MKRKLMELLIKMMLDFFLYTKSYKFFLPQYGGIGHILMLHRVIPTEQIQTGQRFIPTDMEISTDEFENIIAYFQKRGYAFVSLDDVYNILREKNLDNKFVAITFDDGYMDVYNYAYPILKKHGIPFAVNITTGFPDRSVIIWWYLLEELLLNHQHLSFEVNGHHHTYHFANRREKYFAFREIRDFILDSTKEDFLKKMERIFGPLEIDLFKRTQELSLSWDQIREMSRDPLVTIGGHTVNHKPLGKLTEEKIRQEIQGSAARIEEQIGKKVEHFSYPFGRKECGRREFALVKEMGFKTAVTTRFTNIFPEHRDHLECLPRIYKIGEIPLERYLDVLTSGALSAMVYRFKRMV
jgi:peptidoglycan/xylan/chitin deacetylase (PgdA/CDA1 family)